MTMPKVPSQPTFRKWDMKMKMQAPARSHVTVAIMVGIACLRRSADERFDPQPVAGQKEDLSVSVPKRERKHAA